MTSFGHSSPVVSLTQTPFEMRPGERAEQAVIGVIAESGMGQVYRVRGGVEGSVGPDVSGGLRTDRDHPHSSC